jgi:hypothetical protein
MLHRVGLEMIGQPPMEVQKDKTMDEIVVCGVQRIGINVGGHFRRARARRRINGTATCRLLSSSFDQYRENR